MRLKLIFDPKLGLGEYSKVILPVQSDVKDVKQLTELIRETFGLPQSDFDRITLSLDDFKLSDNQFLSDVLNNDDVINVLAKRMEEGEPKPQPVPETPRSTDDITDGPPCKILRTESNHQDEEDSPPVAEICSNPLPGSQIRFVDRTSGAVMQGTVEERFDEPESGTAVVRFTHLNGPKDMLPLSDMLDLEVVTSAYEEDSPVLKIPASRERPVPFELNEGPDPEQVRKGSLWKDKQRKKSVAALRRQVEWFVKQEGVVEVQEILQRPRIRDLCESFEDLSGAVQQSRILKIVSNDAETGQPQTISLVNN